LTAPRDFAPALFRHLRYQVCTRSVLTILRLGFELFF
jgi:hypothetical protein